MLLRLPLPGRATLWAVVLLVTLLGIRFGPALWGQQRLGFRDAGHFYTPLYGYLAERERVEWLPLFNPLDVLGLPLAGETTPAVFYPPRRLIFGWIDSAETALAWYVYGHLILAGLTARLAARSAGASRRGSLLAMLVYPLSGPVFFSYCNPPLLVGAAWLPLALAGGLTLLKHRPAQHGSSWPLLAAALGLAMPILAGDPQASIHVLLFGGGVTLAWLWRCRCRAVLRPLGRLAGAAALAAALAGPQLAASIDWAPHSVRYGPPPESAGDDTYDFSVAPWHWAELVLPSISGHLFPVYTRLSHLVPDDGRTWVVTLYAGLLPLSLTLARYRRGIRRRRLDAWDALLPVGLACSLGCFGIGYLVRWLFPGWAASLGEPSAARDAWCGPYWWLVTVVPGYSGFRYPAKWLVFVSLGIAVAAARQWDWLQRPQASLLARWNTRLALLALLLAVVVIGTVLYVAAEHPQRLLRADPLWGPLDHRRAIGVVALSGLLAGLLAAIVSALVGWSGKLSVRGRRRVQSALLAVVACDLAIASWPTLVSVSRQGERALLAQVAPTGAARALRFPPAGWPPWLREQPADAATRPLIAEASMRNSRFARWHLADALAVFNAANTLPPQRVSSFWTAANAMSRQLAGTERRQFWDRLMGWLAIDQAWVAAPGVEQPDLMQLETIPTRAPAAMVRWHASWRRIEAQRHIAPDALARRLAEVTSGGEEAPPLVEIPGPRAQLPHRSGEPRSCDSSVPDGGPSPGIDRRQQAATLRLERRSAQLWTVHVSADSPGLICLKYFQDGNLRGELLHRNDDGRTWRRQVPVLRCDYLFAGILVPPGQSELRISYRPRWLTPALVTTLAAWLAAAWLGVRGLLHDSWAGSTRWRPLRCPTTSRMYRSPL